MRTKEECASQVESLKLGVRGGTPHVITANHCRRCHISIPEQGQGKDTHSSTGSAYAFEEAPLQPLHRNGWAVRV